MNYFWILSLLFIITLIINFIFVKYNIFIDKDKLLIHKSFVKNNFKVPFSGGLIILIALIFFIPQNYILFKLFFLIIFILGLFADLRLINSPNKRLFLQIIAISIFLYFSKITITSLNIQLFDYFLEFKFISFFFTLFCILILINGSNFLDGINTLVIGYYLLVSLILLYLTQTHNFAFDNNILEIYILSLIILFLFNFFGKLYLGDSGSYLISFFAGIILIELVNKNNFISPYFIALLLWYPAYENLFSIIRKKINKIKPSSPDNNHFHHLVFIFINKFFDNKKISNTFTGLAINIYNALIFIIASEYFYYTKKLIILLVINLIIYSSLYFLLNKNVYKS